MKICPRCMLVDDRNRRVCVGCRRSLISSPELTLAEVLEQRIDAPAGEGAAARVPWGPALGTSGAHGHADDRRGVVSVVLAERPVLDITDGAPPGGGDPPPGPDEDPPPTDTTAEDDAALAQVTRERLARMYDPRANAAVVVDAATPRPSRELTRPDAAERRRRTLARRRRAIGLVMVACVVALVVRAAPAALGTSRDALEDPTTPVERLPWTEVSFGELVAQFPGTSAASTFGDEDAGVFTHRRFDLPDLSITVISGGSAGVAPNDIGLRGVAERLLAEAGGRVTSGSVVATGWGTAYTGTGVVPTGESFVYVARTSGALVEVRADAVGPPGERARQVFERIVRSVQPA